MKRSGGGTMVNTASVVAAVGIGNRAAYCASKGAVAALTRAIAIDHVGEGIHCNAIAPGTIDTPYRRANSSAGWAPPRRSRPESSFWRATKVASPPAPSLPWTAA